MKKIALNFKLLFSFDTGHLNSCASIGTNNIENIWLLIHKKKKRKTSKENIKNSLKIKFINFIFHCNCYVTNAGRLVFSIQWFIWSIKIEYVINTYILLSNYLILYSNFFHFLGSQYMTSMISRSKTSWIVWLTQFTTKKSHKWDGTKKNIYKTAQKW